MNKAIRLLGTITEAGATVTADEDNGFAQLAIGNDKLAIVVSLTAIDAGNLTFTVEENVGGNWFETGESAALTAVSVAEIVPSNFPMMGLGAFPRVTGSGSATAWSAEVYAISWAS